MDKVSYIKKTPGKKEWCVFSHQTGKNFGCYPTKKEAEARLAQIHKFSTKTADLKLLDTIKQKYRISKEKLREVARAIRLIAPPLAYLAMVYLLLHPEVLYDFVHKYDRAKPAYRETLVKKLLSRYKSEFRDFRYGYPTIIDVDNQLIIDQAKQAAWWANHPDRFSEPPDTSLFEHLNPETLSSKKKISSILKEISFQLLG